jgi:hypothetical protein
MLIENLEHLVADQKKIVGILISKIFIKAGIFGSPNISLSKKENSAGCRMFLKCFLATSSFSLSSFGIFHQSVKIIHGGCTHGFNLLFRDW